MRGGAHLAPGRAGPSCAARSRGQTTPRGTCKSPAGTRRCPSTGWRRTAAQDSRAGSRAVRGAVCGVSALQQSHEPPPAVTQQAQARLEQASPDETEETCPAPHPQSPPRTQSSSRPSAPASPARRTCAPASRPACSRSAAAARPSCKSPAGPGRPRTCACSTTRAPPCRPPSAHKQHATATRHTFLFCSLSVPRASLLGTTCDGTAPLDAHPPVRIPLQGPRCPPEAKAARAGPLPPPGPPLLTLLGLHQYMGRPSCRGLSQGLASGANLRPYLVSGGQWHMPSVSSQMPAPSTSEKGHQGTMS